tara:strand:- start:2442 stop:2765 length:324 start_codon:yes stop_codon:yes gene_type:complete
MKLLLLQAEVVQDLLSASDVTIIGVLLAFIAILIYYNIRTDKKLEKCHEYIREQNKANLMMINDLTVAVTGIGQTGEKTAEKVEDVNSKASNILTIIKERLTRQGNE